MFWKGISLWLGKINLSRVDSIHKRPVADYRYYDKHLNEDCNPLLIQKLKSLNLFKEKQ